MSGAKKDYELDYAYVKEKTSEFGSVHVALVIGNEDLTLLIESDEEIETRDLEGLLIGLQKSQFKRLRLNIRDDCKCIFVCSNISYQIKMDYENEKLKVTGLLPIKE